MACNLVKDYPQKALSWFAVGCYYYCIKKYDQSHRYFSKATNLDGTFPPAWIGYGNAYAAREEGDQAMSVYRTAARLFPGCHLPTLYIGMEYMRTHSFKLAEQVTHPLEYIGKLIFLVLVFQECEFIMCSVSGRVLSELVL